MRFGGGVVGPYKSPEEWASLVLKLGYSAIVFPVDYTAKLDVRNAYLKCIKENSFSIGEVGIWRNVLSPDEGARKAAMEYSKGQLALAEEISANCCVNISGSKGAVWDAGYKDNYSVDTYVEVIDSVREIIDSVNPKRTFFTLEPMPWMIPDSPQQYLQLIKDIDRKSFGVHLDYTNMINSPTRYLNQREFIDECFDLLSPYIKSIHIKDVLMENSLPCHIHEVLPGAGSVDFMHILRRCSNLGEKMTIFTEHLRSHDEYEEASLFIRSAMEKL
ncbi:MAG: sugar phosphate isomerase/epimerase [Clostridiales bacterium]|jgi:sugar phosphate isomerase/epimerase|nr:sugar phosphate isomerase/epimerase [Clostridiales bacterium]